MGVIEIDLDALLQAGKDKKQKDKSEDQDKDRYV